MPSNGGMDDALLAVETWTQGLIQTLRLARAMVDAQRPVALDGLIDQAGFVCAKVMDLPPEQGRQVRGRMVVLLAEVDAVSAAIRRQAPPPRQKADPCRYRPPPS